LFAFDDEPQNINLEQINFVLVAARLGKFIERLPFMVIKPW
jgi:hypothetical protein